jgi:hypothetical protein
MPEEKYTTDNGLGFNFDLEWDGPDTTFDDQFLSENRDRYHNPAKYKGIKEKHVKYSHALRAANYIELGEGLRSHMITAGSFEFGDFLEALLKERQIQCRAMSISTLSMSQNNIDSLGNLLHDGWVDRLDLIVSDYFFAHERQGLMPYLLNELDHEDKFQLAVAGSHTKIITFETYGGKKFVMHGSANLRSSGCLEQTTIEENPGLYDFYTAFHDDILREYSVINKPIRNKKLWQVVAASTASTTPTDRKAGPPAADAEDSAQQTTASTRLRARRSKG